MGSPCYYTPLWCRSIPWHSISKAKTNLTNWMKRKIHFFFWVTNSLREQEKRWKQKSPTHSVELALTFVLAHWAISSNAAGGREKECKVYSFERNTNKSNNNHGSSQITKRLIVDVCWPLPRFCVCLLSKQQQQPRKKSFQPQTNLATHNNENCTHTHTHAHSGSELSWVETEIPCITWRNMDIIIVLVYPKKCFSSLILGSGNNRNVLYSTPQDHKKLSQFLDCYNCNAVWNQ